VYPYVSVAPGRKNRAAERLLFTTNKYLCALIAVFLAMKTAKRGAKAHKRLRAGRKQQGKTR
jgi:hypothetical protein